MSTRPLTTNTSNFDTSDKPSMGDPDVVDGLVRVMFNEARAIMFEADNPQAEVPGFIDRWTAKLSPDNDAYVQTWSARSLATFLRARGFGTDDPDTDTAAPLKAMLAWTVGRFVKAGTNFHDEKIDESQLQFEIETAVEDCSCLLRGLDNPAD